MTERLHSIAEHDTPSAVAVPNNVSGLIIWAAGRFGSGILLAIACGWALTRVYDDQKALQERMMILLEQRSTSDTVRAKADSELATAISGMRITVDEIAREARGAHKLPQLAQ